MIAASVPTVESKELTFYYQDEAVDATLLSFERKINPLIVLPTGSGKSHVLGKLCKKILESDSNARILVVSHVQEILEQDEKAICNYIEPAFVGIYSAALGRKERRKVTVAGIGSVYKKASETFAGTTHIIIDEAHKIPVSGDGMYIQLLDGLENAVVIGLTATPYRLGKGYLIDYDLFDEVVYEKPVEELIQEGYLSPLHHKEAENLMDLDGVKTQGGDFSTKSMHELLGLEQKIAEIVVEVIRYKDTRKSWLLFAIDIEYCEMLAEFLNDVGIKTAFIHSKMKDDRAQTILDFKAGEYQALVSVATLTTGFDHPAIDLVALCRPTKSPVLHVQMIGRGLRISPEKKDCLILDFAGNVERLGPINDVHIAVKGKQRGEAPTKTCPECNTMVPASSRACYFCGAEFAFEKGKELETSSGNNEIVQMEKPILVLWHDVESVTYEQYQSKAGNDLLLVKYSCGLRIFNEYVSIGADGQIGYKAAHWWNFRTRFGNHPDYRVPIDGTAAAFRANNNELKQTLKIKVNEEGRYPSIIDAKIGN